jgi:beta-glucosidase
MAAAWDRELAAERAQAIAEEMHDKGVNFWLGPVTGGPLGRSALAGRNFEGFSPDSYLSGENSFASVRAAQEVGVLAVSKHFIAYESETFRDAYAPNQSVIDASGENYQRVLAQLPIDSQLDDRATHEAYMWSFAEAVRAG